MCKEESNIYNNIRRRARLYLPDYPQEEWCDFRQDYESGMTLKQIAEKYLCDPRTVRKSITANKSSSEIGSQTAPTKLAAFAERIDALYGEYVFRSPDSSSGKQGICEISRRITDQLQQDGYTGSERTVRNYLRSNYQFVARQDEEDKEADNA